MGPAGHLVMMTSQSYSYALVKIICYKTPKSCLKNAKQKQNKNAEKGGGGLVKMLLLENHDGNVTLALFSYTRIFFSFSMLSFWLGCRSRRQRCHTILDKEQVPGPDAISRADRFVQFHALSRQ